MTANTVGWGVGKRIKRLQVPPGKGGGGASGPQSSRGETEYKKIMPFIGVCGCFSFKLPSGTDL